MRSLLTYRVGTLPSTWVKNVYSLCAEGVVTRVNSYTATYQKLKTTYQLGVKTIISTPFVNTFPPILYTAITNHLPDTNYHLPTISTAPIIKKKR